jgi:hypothetical protein
MNAIHRLIGMGCDQLVSEILGHASPTPLLLARLTRGADR